MEIGNVSAASDYIFRFDTALPPMIFGGEADLHGWLLHREGKPIHGLRVIARRGFAQKRILKGRRKRNRPDVASAFPDRADAEASGFLFELQFRLGRNELEFQVLDYERKWRTFANASVTALPLTLLSSIGLKLTRHFLISHLQQRRAGRRVVGEAASFPSLPSEARVLPKRVDLFATSKSNLFIIEIGELVAAGFRELGCEAQLHLDEMPAANPPSDQLQIVVTPHEYYNLFLTEKFSRDQCRELTRNVHLLCTEQPETGWFEGNIQWGGYSLGVADINPLGVAAYRARGLPARQLHLGYHPILAHTRLTPHAERSHDITFLGSLTDRRDKFFAEHADFFARHRCHLRFVPLGFAKTEETRSYLSAERRNELLSQSRILLNVHYSEQKYFEWHRMLVGLANGCCIITETCEGYGPLVPQEHFVMVAPEYLITTCEYFLANPGECERIARAGFEFVQTKLRQAQTCQAFLEGTMDLPADGSSASLPRALAQKMTRQTRRLFFQSLGSDLRKPFAKQPPIEPPKEPNRFDVIQKREAYKARLTKQEEMRRAGEPVFATHDNEAFARVAEPKLSVVITLYNYAQHIEECIASVAHAAERLREAFEVVVVNDASTDDSLAKALTCQRDSHLAIRVLDKKFNTGLADARNTGITLARAPYIFMLDADNLVFPDALRELLQTISQADYDAAYSVLCRFRGGPEKRVGLLSYFDWDPQILVQYPYIDAMAMFRRETLLGLGGYDNHLSQIGWFGWEDYDMWLKYVQQNCRVAFVPNTLCLYRHHDTSMIKTTNLFEPELVEHFLSRYGHLLERYEPREKVFGVLREKIECRSFQRGEKDSSNPGSSSDKDGL